jgi:hypothetical protein
MPISLRPATSQDLDSAARLVQLSINDLKVRHGLEPSMPFAAAVPVSVRDLAGSRDHRHALHWPGNANFWRRCARPIAPGRLAI